MSNNTKIIILDGVGINLKTTLMNEAQDDGFITVKSDSSYYQIANPNVFYNLDDYSTKLQCRFMEIMTALDICSSIDSVDVNKEAIFVDRGLLNQVIWASMCHDEIIDDYLQNKKAYRKLMNMSSEIIQMEQSLGATNILITTDRRDIVDVSLDETLYGIDPHATFRIDTFYDTDHYFEIQSEYLARYRSYCTPIEVTITNQGTPYQEVQRIYEEIKKICKL